MRTLLPAYPAVLAKLADAPARAITPTCSAGRRGCSPARPRASTCSCSTRRISTTGRATPISAPTGATGPTTPIASPRWRGSAPTSALARSPAFAPDVVHAHDWQAALAPAYLHFDGGPRPGRSSPIHNLAFQGHFPLRSSATSACPPARFDRRRRVFRRRRLSEGGSAVRRPHHHRLADLRRAKS